MARRTTASTREGPETPSDNTNKQDMAKLDQILIIEPKNELRFRGPFTGVAPVASYMKLTNPSEQKVYFKIKTTAPKRYCVRPNCGVLKPHQTTDIAVCLQLYDFDPNEKNRHKFMVQSFMADNNDDDEVPDVWKDLDPSRLMDTKLKCVFENPVTNTTAAKTKTFTTTTTSKSDTNSNDGKNKAIGDTAKSSPKLVGETEEKLIMAAEEVNQLRVEENRLRLENVQLKDDIIRWRNMAMHSSSGTSSQSSNQLPLPTTIILIAVAMVVVGYLLGKLI